LEVEHVARARIGFAEYRIDCPARCERAFLQIAINILKIGKAQ